MPSAPTPPPSREDEDSRVALAGTAGLALAIVGLTLWFIPSDWSILRRIALTVAIISTVSLAVLFYERLNLKVGQVGTHLRSRRLAFSVACTVLFSIAVVVVAVNPSGVRADDAGPRGPSEASTPATASRPSTTAPSVSAPPTTPIVSQQVQSLSTSKCLDVRGPRIEDGTPLQLWDCIDVPEERWHWSGSQIVGYWDKCVTVDSSAEPPVIELATCDDRLGQQWRLSGDGQLTSDSGFCVSVAGESVYNGTSLSGTRCTAESSQLWRFY